MTLSPAKLRVLRHLSHAGPSKLETVARKLYPSKTGVATTDQLLRALVGAGLVSCHRRVSMVYGVPADFYSVTAKGAEYLKDFP